MKVSEFIKKYGLNNDIMLPLVNPMDNNNYGKREAFVLLSIKKHYSNEDLADLTIFNPDNFMIHNVHNISLDTKFKVLPVEDYKKMMFFAQKTYIAHKLTSCGKSFTMGADPEMFVEDENGVIIPAFDFLQPPTNPHIYGGAGNSPKKYSLFWDGFQAEFTIPEKTCLEYYSDAIQEGLTALYRAAIKHNPNARLSLKSVMEVPQEIMQRATGEQQQFACSPSKNIYTESGESDPIIIDPAEVLKRPAGGHIHLGGGNIQKFDKKEMIKAIDAIAAVSCVSMFAGFDDPERRKLYGRAGEYRDTSYGFEYRVLSNAWLTHPLIMHIAVDLVRRATHIGAKGLLKYWKCPTEETIRIINECDVTAARKVLLENRRFFLAMLKPYYEAAAGTQGDSVDIFKIIYKGMSEFVEDPTDIKTNWRLLTADEEKTELKKASAIGTTVWQTQCQGIDTCWRKSKYTIKTGKKVS